MWHRKLKRFCRLIVVALSIAGASSGALAAPGRMLSAVPMQGAPSNAVAWRIRYETTDVTGQRTESTGVVIIPRSPPPRGGRNIVAWAHPTVGIAESCAPSLKASVFETIPQLQSMIARNWVIVATDYPGLGTPGPHAYLVGDAAARAVLDSVRAAGNFSRVGAGRQFAVWGLSQGAHAALFTGEQARRYAPDLQLAGVAAAAPPTDLSANLGDSVDPTVRAALTAYAAQSWSRVYGADLSTIASPTGRRVIGQLASHCVSEDPSLSMKIEVLRLRRQLKGVDLTRTDPWKNLLVTNSAGRSPAGAPLLIAQSSGDKVVAPDVTRAFVSRACGRGEHVRFIPAGDGPHATTARVSADQTIAWIGDRFEQRAPPSNCAR